MFEGNSQTLDHILVSDGALAEPPGTTSSTSTPSSSTRPPTTTRRCCNRYRSEAPPEPTTFAEPSSPHHVVLGETRAVAASLNGALSNAENARLPLIRTLNLALYRLGVTVQSGSFRFQAFTAEEGAELIRQSRLL